MHREAYEFVARVRDAVPDLFVNKKVLEFGSLNVNGTVRGLFANCTYVGVDAVPGPCVDVVCLAHQFSIPDTMRGTVQAPFDVLVSCELFEHDPYLEQTIKRGLSLLKSRGLFVFTCAGPGRAEHGTRRTEDAGGTWGPNPDYYRNVTAAELVRILDDRFVHLTLEYGRGTEDLYCFGVAK